MKVFFKTFGCRTNIFDTQIMIASLESCEIARSENDADIVVINSCTVTNGADKDVKDYISRIKKLDKKILFTGCALDSVGKEMFAKGSVFGAFGHSKKEEISALLQNNTRFYFDNDLSHLDSTIIDKFVGKSRAFIKIQEGCNFKCSYCVIPQVRGKSRSYEKNKIILQIKKLADSGISEVVLSGTNLGSYGKDTNDTLPKLLIDISKISGIKRIRLGSLEPSQIKDDFLEILDSSFLEKHLHIAVQYTDNEMLKIMNRINRFEKDLILFEKIAKKGFALGSDFIVGHPFESEEIFNNAFENLKILPLTHIHAFIYSPRTNTKSAKMPLNVPKDKAKERLHLIRALIDDKNRCFRESKRQLDVLVENKKDGFFYGLDQFFNRIQIKSSSDLSLQWLQINDYKIQEGVNYAEI